MSRWPRDDSESLQAFYGTPGEGGSVEDNLVHVVPPFAMYYDGKRLKSLVFHRKAAPALQAALNEIWQQCGKDQERVDAIRASITGGTYNPRKIRGSSRWSMHAYGCAIDIDPERNAMGSGRGKMSRIVIDAFDRQGFRWGGRYKGRTDPMHFEAVDPGAVPMPAKPPPLKPVTKDDLRNVPLPKHRPEIEPEEPDESDEEDTPEAEPEKPPEPPPPKPMVKSKIGWIQWLLGFIGLGGAVGQVDDGVSGSIHHALDTAQSIGLFDILKNIATRPWFWLFLVVWIGACLTFYWRWREYGRGRTLVDLRAAHAKAEEAHAKADRELAEAEAEAKEQAV